MKPDPNKPVIEISPDAAVPFSEDTIAMHNEYSKTLEMIGDVAHYNAGDSPASFSEWEDSLAGGGLPGIGQLWDTPLPPHQPASNIWKPPYLQKEPDYYLIDDEKANLLPAEKSEILKKIGSLALSQPPLQAAEIKPERAGTAAEWFAMHMSYGDATDWDRTPLPAEMRQEVHEMLFADLRRQLDKGLTYHAHLVIAAMLGLFPERYTGEMDIAQALKDAGDELKVLLYPKTFGDIQYNQDDVILLLADGHYEVLLRNWDTMDGSVDRRSVLELVAEQCPLEILSGYLYAIAKSVELPETLVFAAVQNSPYAVSSLLREGLLTYIDNEKLFELYADHLPGAAWEALRYMRVSIDNAAIDRLVQSGHLPITTVLGLKGRIDGLATVEEITAWLSRHVQLLQQSIRGCGVGAFDMATLKAIFNVLFDAPDSDIRDLLRFASSEEEYLQVINTHKDALLELIKNGSYTAVVEVIINLADKYDTVRQLYEMFIEPAVEERHKFNEAKIVEAKLQNQRRANQRAAELTYFEADNYKINMYDSDADLSDEAVCQAFEREHCVKKMPTLAKQAEDDSRNNLIISVGAAHGIGVDTNESDYKRRTHTEHDALAEYYATLTKIAHNADLKDIATLAESLRDNLTFIGEKEYREAAKATATYWKWWLDKDESRQLFVLKGAISSEDYVKSDEYLFDRILQYFSDEEMAKYKDRLIVRQEDIIDDSPERLKVVLLDDWTISGSQLRSAASSFLSAHPDSGGCLEIGLLCASKERIALGLEGIKGHYVGGILQKDISIPVKSYYMAHTAPIMDGDSSRGVHITGAHSSVDYGFENTLTAMRVWGGNPLPPIANIVRPYREKGYQRVNAARLMRLYGLTVGHDRLEFEEDELTIGYDELEFEEVEEG